METELRFNPIGWISETDEVLNNSDGGNTMNDAAIDECIY